MEVLHNGKRKAKDVVPYYNNPITRFGSCDAIVSVDRMNAALILALRLELVIAYQVAGDYSFCASVTV